MTTVEIAHREPVVTPVAGRVREQPAVVGRRQRVTLKAREDSRVAAIETDAPESRGIATALDERHATTAIAPARHAVRTGTTEQAILGAVYADDAQLGRIGALVANVSDPAAVGRDRRKSGMTFGVTGLGSRRGGIGQQGDQRSDLWLHDGGI